MNTETILQNSIRLALSKYGIVIRMNTGYFKTFDGRTIKSNIKGMPDLLFIGNGYVAFIEVKTDAGKPTVDQERFINRMRSMHHRAGIARSVEDALKIIGGEA